MTVKELIEQLQKLDPEMPVMIPGKEGGYWDLEKIYSTKVILNLQASKDNIVGPHDRLEGMFTQELVDYIGAKVIIACILPR